SSEDYDIRQDAATVLVVDQGSSTLTAIDPARVSLTDSATIPGDAKVELGDRTTAVLDRTSGALWVLGADEIAGFDIKAVDPLLELGKNADVTVGRDGTVYAVSAKDAEIVTIPVDAQGPPEEPTTASVEAIDEDSTPTITVVGDVPVVLDTNSGLVVAPGGLNAKIDGGEDAVLQQASAASDSVAIATRSALLSAPLGGGDIVVTQAGGTGT